MCGLSVLLEEVSRQPGLLDAQNIFNVLKLLSFLVNVSYPYTYGDSGMLTKLKAVQQEGLKVEDVNGFVRAVVKQVHTKASPQKFLIDKRAFISISSIIFCQSLNLQYNLTVPDGKSKHSRHTS